MSSQSFVNQSNGGIPRLGWARLVQKFGAYETIKLYDDVSQYGRFYHGLPTNFREGFVFTSENTPMDILQYVSDIQFSIERETRPGEVNCSPAVLKSHGKNGVWVNKIHVPTNGSRILQIGDYIKIGIISAFQFLDDRELDVAGIPYLIKRRYHLDSYFGNGSQSWVRLVHDQETQIKFAMKVISKERYEVETLYHHSKRIQHMSNEVQSMQQLRHDNIIRLIEAVDDKNLFIIMEYGSGGDLLQYMNSFPGSCLPEHEAKFCYFQICNGLKYIHSKNIAHRDIKAENIFIAKIGTEKVMKIGDFGFSKNAKDHLMTQLGTRCFFPPEIQERSGEYSLKADIWTLGCLFYTCLTGTFPFHSSYGPSLSQQIRDGHVDFNRSQFYSASHCVESLIKVMLQTDPDRRPTVEQIVKQAPWFVNDLVLINRISALNVTLNSMKFIPDLESTKLEPPKFKKPQFRRH